MGSDVPSDVRMPLMMPDDFSDMHLVAWRVERGTLDENNPLLEGDTPWDGGGVGIHGSVFKDPIDGKWKAYLVGTPPEFHQVGDKPWISNNHGHRYLCLYESDDGINWTRPELSIVPLEGHPKTNILFGILTVYPSLFVDPGNKEWPYEMFVLHENSALGPAPDSNGFYRYRSKDGKHWDRISKAQGPMTGDLGMVQRNLEGPGYVCFFRLAGPRQPNDHVPLWEDAPRRTCMRATSLDGNKWDRDPVMVLTCDKRDHRDTQYQEQVPVKVEGGYLAMITMYHPITQTLNLRMAASRDSRRWWFPDRVPCLDNPPMGDYGGGMIWQSQNLIVQDDKLYVYFGGTEGSHRQLIDTRAPSMEIGPMEKIIDHGAHFIPFNAALCRAYWRFDRMYALVSSAGGPTVGAATTHSKQLDGSELWVNVTTKPAKKSSKKGFHEGCLQVELLDEAGSPIAGYTRDDCMPMKGDHQALQVTWNGGDVCPAGARQVKFYLMRAMLYGFEFRGLNEGATARRGASQKLEHALNGVGIRAGTLDLFQRRQRMLSRGSLFRP